MKSRDGIVRLKRFQVEEKRRQLAQIDGMIAEFERMSAELTAQVAAEEARTGITDVNHFAYSTFAKAAHQRRDNLKASAGELRVQRDGAAAALALDEEELARLAALADREDDRDDPRPAPSRKAG
ncbi:MAG: flagellar export protein FliJ [Bauldia sp.]